MGSSHAVCGCPRVGCGTRDMSCELFRAGLAEAAFTGQPPSCLEHKGTQSPVLWEGLVENQAPVCGAAYVSVSCSGQKARGDGSAGFAEQKWLWASQRITGSETLLLRGCQSPSGSRMEERAEPRGNKPSASPGEGTRNVNCSLSQHHVHDTWLHLSMGRGSRKDWGSRKCGMGAGGAGALQSFCGENLA